MYNVIKSIINEKKAHGILFVLKGFDIDISGYEKIKLSDVMINKVGRLFSLVNQENQVIAFEEFICMYDLIISQYKKIIILENPEYMNLYPINVLLEDKVIESLLVHFNDEVNGDVELLDITDFTDVYSNFVQTECGFACCYNIGENQLKAEKIERINIRISEEKDIKIVLASEINDEYLSICNEKDYFQLVQKLQTTDKSYVVSWDAFIPDRDVIKHSLSILNGLYEGRLATFFVDNINDEPLSHNPEVYKIMEKYWGYKEFLPIKTYDITELEKGNKKVISVSQERIVSDLIEQVENCREGKHFRDIFVTASTGSGKSLMFQIPAIYIGEKYGLVTLVITPLIGLMDDQVDTLINKGYHKARKINSDMSQIEKENIINEFATEKCHILYLSPESLLSRSDIEALIGKRQIGMLIVDEAHIVTTWGKQFRPDYWYLGDHVYKLRKKQSRDKDNPMPFIIATFTATAIYQGNEDMYRETLNSLQMTDPITYLGYVRRNNIAIDIGEVELKKNKLEYEVNKFDSLISMIKTAIIRNKKVLIYFPTVALINRFGDYCYSKNLGDYVAKYHGQMNGDIKKENFQEYLSGKKMVMIATKAFGMGIDIKDIAIVAHFAPTGNVCDYMQEIGRAARDKSIEGQAIYKHMSNDFQHINRLHGLSVIKKYQLIEVIKKILELYTAYRYGDGNEKNRHLKKRNEMLVDTECFGYIFEGPMSDDSDLLNKVKTAMLLIQKDYENRGYAPFYMKPVPIFAYGYFAIKPQTQRMINAKYPGAVEVKYSPLNVCEVKLRKIWEETYEKIMSFPKFKYMIYTGDEKLDFNKKYTFATAMMVEIYLEDDYNRRFIKLFEVIKEATHMSIYKGEYIYFDQLVDELVSKTGISKYKAEAIFNVILAAMDVYRREYAQRMNGNIYKSNTNRNGVVSYLFTVASREFFAWIDKGYRYVLDNLKDQHMYIVNDGSGKNMKEIITLLGIFEAFGLMRFKSLGGSNSQIYIYINETKTMTMVRDRPYTYKNELLDLINYRHNESVKMLSYLFQNKFDSEQLWEHLENYFLGILPEELMEKEDKVDINDLELVSIVFQTGDSLSDDYDTWCEANILFDNEVIGKLDSMNIPLADYYNARLMIGEYTVNVDLAWIDKQLLITSGEEEEELRELAKKSGWTCIPMDNITKEFLISFFE